MAAAMKKSAHLFAELNDEPSTAASASPNPLPAYFLSPAPNRTSLPSNSATLNSATPIASNGEFKLAFTTRSRIFNSANMAESLRKTDHIFKDFLGDTTVDKIESNTPSNRRLETKENNILKVDATPLSASTNQSEAATPLQQQQLSAEDRAEIENSLRAFMADELETTSRICRKSHIKPKRLTDRFHAEDEVIHQHQEDAASIKAARMVATEKQLQMINEKRTATISSGSLYQQKCENKSKLKWRQIGVNDCTSVSNQFLPRIARQSSEYVDEFKFPTTNDATIKLDEDNIEIVPNPVGGSVGIAELSVAFRACPNVDPSLLPPNWIEHHMRLIYIKLGAYERSFRMQFPNCLSAGNVMLQLKYRYDREIDRAHRSVLRRITEQDSAAGGRMCLYVSRCGSADGIIQLSDGHYYIGAQFDEPLERAANAGRLSVGTKLLIHGAQLVHADEPAVHPLAAPASMRLKLHANSTRRTNWDAKLGRCQTVGPFQIRLDSVLPTGGQIGRVLVRVVRKYPILYKLDGTGSNEILSERMYRRRQMAEIKPNIEQLYAEAEMEVDRLEAAAAAAAAASDKICMENIDEIDDPCELYRLVRLAKDPDVVHSKLSCRQRDRILAYLQNDRRESIEKRVREKLDTFKERSNTRAEKNWSNLLKFKIVDAIVPKRLAQLSIWNPSEAHRAITEGETYEINGANAIGIRDGCLLLGTSKWTNFERRSSGPVTNHFLSISDVHKSDRVAGTEFDTRGIVISLGAILPRSFQRVYIANESRQLLVVHMWGGVGAYAWEDLFKPGRCLAMRHLHFRSDRGDDRLPNAFVSELTTCEIVDETYEDANEFIRLCKIEVNNVNALAVTATATNSPMTPISLVKKETIMNSSSTESTPLRRVCLRNRRSLKLGSSSTPRNRFRSPLIDATNGKN